MSGESQRDAEPDFLDDDFILEDVAAKNEGLEQLFEMPDEAKMRRAQGSVAPDSDDMLFTDHTQGLQPTEKFDNGPAFSEAVRSGWTGDGLDLESVGVPGEEPEFREVDAAALAGAEASFTAELDSLLQSSDEFSIDGDKELELVESGGRSDGIAEFEQSGPFVLDDGEGIWQEEKTQGEAALGVPLEPVLAGEDAGEVEPGWEPLEPQSVDELSEVDEVARAEEHASYDSANDDQGDLVAADAFAEQEAVVAPARRPALVGAGAPVEGHDLYVSDEPAAVIGGRVRRGGARRMLVALAASVMVMAAGAVVVMRPEWIGLQLEFERVQQVQVARPEVAVVVEKPRLPERPSAGSPSGGEQPGGAITQPTPPVPPVVATTDPPTSDPSTTSTTPPTTEPAPVPVVSTSEGPTVATTTQTDPPTATTTSPTGTGTDPTAGGAGSQVAVAPEAAAPLPLVSPAHSQSQWPVPIAGGAEGDRVAGSGSPGAPLLRINEDLLMGEREEVSRPVKAVEGVMPGSRAFAQLHNGNYFIGSVKCVDAERLTLHIDTGEVTLSVAAIARLTELGSADYEELQRVTSGFVRLTNNNRLVGGILSHIADDHVVLEFRSNRVMLPRSAVGQVVQGEGDAAVRLDTTREEDDWLRRLIERQLGSGTGVPLPGNPAPAPLGGAGGARTPR